MPGNLSAAPVQAPAPVPIGPQTVPRLAAAMVQNLRAKAARFQLTLDPAGLGRVDVSVRIGADGAVSATLNFNSAQAAEALKAHAGELRAALQQAGFNLGGSDLNFLAGGSGQQQGGSQNGSSAAPRFAGSLGSSEAQAAETPAARTAVQSADGVDIRI
jgi:Meckel syndrome type 1 protein